MIRAVTDGEALEEALLRVPNDIFSGKIRAIARAYGFSHDFARFYASGAGAVIAAYYGAAILAGGADGEVPMFCKAAGFKEVLMPESAYLSAFSELPAGRFNIMSYKGRYEPLPGEIDTAPPYDKFLETIREAFGAELDGWYVDTCHRVRHGITSLYMWDGAAVQCAFADRGIALLTVVSVKKELRGKGRGKRLVRAVSAGLSRGNEVFIICRDDVTGFYEKADFVKTGVCRILEYKRGKITT